MRVRDLVSCLLALGLGAAPAYAQGGVVPPRVTEVVDPSFPPGEVAGTSAVEVGLSVVIEADGHLRSAEVTRSAGPAFDEAALAVVERWRFAPATRDGVPFASRVALVVVFHAPATAPTPGGEPDPDHVTATDAPPPSDQTTDTADEDVDEDSSDVGTVDVRDAMTAAATVEAEVEQSAEARVVAPSPGERPTTASQFVLSREALDLAPHADAASMLRLAPGVVVTRPEGQAVAQRIVLRGFDADHGQDIELRVEGIPINQPSHLHGQGYADLGFVVPEAVRAIRVQEGVYDPRQGDFAVAGSADFDLGVVRRGTYASSTFASFRTFRELLLVAPDDEDEATFVAFDARSTRGFGDHRAGVSASALGSYVLDTPGLRLQFLGAAAGARSDIAGVVRSNDVPSVGYYGAYDDPSAAAQSAFSARGLFALLGEHRDDDGRRLRFGFFGGLVDFRSATNFTGYLESARIDPSFRGRGDLNEQRNRQVTVGFQFAARSARYEPRDGFSAVLEFGTSGRLDRIDQHQSLLASPQNEVWDERVDADVLGLDLAVYGDAELSLGTMATLHLGARADALHYDVDDHLGNFIPAYRGDDYVVGYRRTAAGFVGGPRASLELNPARGPRFYAAYGEGYRSPQALALEDGERAPYTKVRSADLGLRGGFDRDHVSLRGSASAFYTHLDDDVVFEPGDNRYERIGASRRAGVTATAELEAFSFLDARFSLTAVRAELLDPPAATVDDPDPPFRSGELLPYVPRVVGRLDLGFEHAFDGAHTTLTGGFGGSFVGARPLPYAAETAPYFVLDARVAVVHRSFDVTLFAENLGGSRYPAAVYSFVSNWDPSGVPSRIPARHLAAGAPRSFGLTLGVRL